MRTIAVILLLAALSACEKNAEQRKAEDAAAIAVVNAAQNRLPPLKMVTPEPLQEADLARIDASGPGCLFGNADGTAPPLLMMVGSFGWIKIEGEVIRLAGDSGSAATPARTWSHYSGKAFTLRIEPIDAAAAATGDPGRSYPANLVVRDAYDRVVYRVAGLQDCTT